MSVGIRRVLVTGAGGFAGVHAVAALRRHELEVIATTRSGGDHPLLGPVVRLDVTDPAQIEQALARFRPTHVLHLAAVAAPTAVDADPEAAWRVNLHATLQLSRAIVRYGQDCRLLYVGSGLAYGDSARLGVAVDEDFLLRPVDEYGASKAAADLAVGALGGKGLRSVRLRPFNHTGAGQAYAFVIPALASQIARIEAGLAPPVLRVGNLDAHRDFLDVRDVAEAYACAVVADADIPSGTVLNIASGHARKIADVLDALVGSSTAEIAVERDPARMRPSDLPFLVGNADRARDVLGWEPSIPFGDTLQSVLADCRARVVH